MSRWLEDDFYLFTEGTPEGRIWLQEEMVRAPALLLPKRQPVEKVRLDKTHSLYRGMVGCWPFWQHNPAFVADLTGNNHARQGGTNPAHLIRMTNPYGRGLTVSGDNRSSRLTLGTINSENPLSCNANNEISIFTWATLGNIVNSGFPRAIDKSNGGSAANGWALALRWQGATPPDNTVDFYVNTNDWTPGEDAMGTSSADYAGTTYGLGVVAASGDQEYIWKDQIIGSSTGTFTIPTTATSAALLNWNHTTDRQWGDQPAFYTVVWDRRLDAQELLDLSFDPYQIFIPA